MEPDRTIEIVQKLADFFPVLVDLGLHEQAFGRPDYYRIRQADGAVNFICTALGNLNAGWYLTRDIARCGAGLDASMLEATFIPVPSGGFALPATFTQWLRQMGGRGVILVEGVAASSEPLVLEAIIGGQVIATATLPMRIAPVEQMYMRVNLRDGSPVVTTGSARPPGNNKDVVFLHGFNVNQGDARAWHAEMFKRLWRSGLNARFHAVTWRGDIGIVNAFHYHANVVSAFETAPHLKSYLDGLTSEKIVMAHSLGTLVVSSAITDLGMVTDKFFMLNAALASECFDAGLWNDAPDAANDMVHDNWTGYTNACWSAKWHEFFLGNPADDRRLLTWKARFQSVLTSTTAYNFYSGGDEVFELRATTPDIFAGASASLGRYAWHKQETLKGRGTATLVGTSWAGWGFGYPTYTTNINGMVYTFEHYPTAAAVNVAPATKLRDIPVFRHNPSAMFTNAIPSATRNEILAKGIPALSPAVGKVVTGVPGRNFDMDTAFKPVGGAWGRSGEPYDARWLHNDIKNMAFFYTHRLFERMIELGEMK